MLGSRRGVRSTAHRMDLFTKCAVLALCTVAVIAVAQSWLPYGRANEVGFGGRLVSPSSGWELLGTDQLGRAMLPRVLAGTAVTLGIAVPSAIVAAAVAALIACFAATIGGWL